MLFSGKLQVVSEKFENNAINDLNKLASLIWLLNE